MKIAEYNQMMKYLTRPAEPEYEQFAMAGAFKGGKKLVEKLVKKGKAPKTDVEKVRAQKKAFDETEKELAKSGQIPVKDQTDPSLLTTEDLIEFRKTNRAGKGQFTNAEAIIARLENTIRDIKPDDETYEYVTTTFPNFIRELKANPKLAENDNVFNTLMGELPDDQRFIRYDDGTVDFQTKKPSHQFKLREDLDTDRKGPTTSDKKPGMFDDIFDKMYKDFEDTVPGEQPLTKKKRTLNAEGGVVEREGFKKGSVEGVDFSRTQTKKFKFPFIGRYGTLYYPNPIERKAQQTPQVIKKYKAIKNSFDKAIETENYDYLVSSSRGKGKLPNQYANEINKLKFGTNEFNKFAERIGLDKNTLKDVLNERQNFIAGKKTEATRRGILGKVKNQKIIMETLQKNSSDLKTLAKKTGLTQIQTKEELRKLLQNIYAQRVQIGKGKYAIKGDWSIFLPTDETKLDKLQKNFWNTKGIPQIKKDTIGDLFYKAYGKDTLADNVTPNPTRNPARYQKILQKLREYNNIKDVIEKNTDIKLDLDHPLDRTALKSINATADQMVRVTPVSRSVNRGLKEKLQQKINQVNKDIKTVKGAKLFELNNQKKSLNNLVNYLELEFGKISPSGKIKRFGVEPFEKLNLKKEIIDNLSFQNVLADRIKQPEFKELVKKAGLEGFKFNVEKIDTDKLEKAILKNVSDKTVLSEVVPGARYAAPLVNLTSEGIMDIAKGVGTVGQKGAFKSAGKGLLKLLPGAGLGYGIYDTGVGFKEGVSLPELGTRFFGLDSIYRYAQDQMSLSPEARKIQAEINRNIAAEAEDVAGLGMIDLQPAKEVTEEEKQILETELEKIRQNRELLNQQRAQERLNILNLIEGKINPNATAYRSEFKAGGPGDKKKTTPTLDKPTVQIDPNAPVDPAKRDTLKGVGILGAGVALGKLGLLKLGKAAKVAKVAKVAPLTKVVAPLGKTMTEFPEWFPTLINKVRKEGKQIPIYKEVQIPITKAEYNKLTKEKVKNVYDAHLGRTDWYKEKLKKEGVPRYTRLKQTDEIIGYKYEVKDLPDVDVVEYGGEELTVSFPNAYRRSVTMEYTPPKGTKDATFRVDDAVPESGGYPGDVPDFYPETVNNLDEVYGGASRIEQKVLKLKKPRYTQGDEVVARADAQYDVIKDTAEDLDEF